MREKKIGKNISQLFKQIESFPRSNFLLHKSAHIHIIIGSRSNRNEGADLWIMGNCNHIYICNNRCIVLKLSVTDVNLVCWKNGDKLASLRVDDCCVGSDVMKKRTDCKIIYCLKFFTLYFSLNAPMEYLYAWN